MLVSSLAILQREGAVTLRSYSFFSSLFKCFPDVVKIDDNSVHGSRSNSLEYLCALIEVI